MISALGMCDRDFTRQTFGVQDADPFRLRSTRQGIAHHHELVSAESRQNITWSGLRRQTVCYLDENIVASLVPCRVVDVLEIIKVQEQQRNKALVIAGREPRGELVQKVRTIGQTSQAVRRSASRQEGLCFTLTSDVDQLHREHVSVGRRRYWRHRNNIMPSNDWLNPCQNMSSRDEISPSAAAR